MPVRPDRPRPYDGPIDGPCPRRDPPDVGVLVAPDRPRAGRPLRVLAATFDGDPLRPTLAIRLRDADGTAVEAQVRADWGEPDAVILEAVPARAGRFVAEVARDGAVVACRTVRVRPRGRPVAPSRSMEDPWPIRRTWTPAEEALYAAFVRELFRGARDETIAHRALHERTSDPAHNLLWNSLGLGEDRRPEEGGLFLQPDCADTPYFLRAYFGWKRGLPMGFRHCSRGVGRPPACGPWMDLVAKIDRVDGDDPVARVGRLLSRTLAWGVHSGNGRVPHDTGRSDFYPVALSHQGVRPGTIYADPYGHIFVVVGWMPPSGGRPGVLFAVDGQPDGSLTRKPFWQGNFLWNPDPTLGESGFKAFRPIVRAGASFRPASNEAIAARPDTAYAGDRTAMDAETFYDTMDRLISPGVRDPFAVMRQLVEHLAASVRVRVRSVENGVAFVAAHPDRPIPMPEGAAIFETTGPWEAYSTPARDLRLLIAIDVVEGFPARVRRDPAAFDVPPERVDETVTALSRLRDELLADPAFAIGYVRSDGSKQRLTLAEIVARKERFEMAYHPLDCPEIRWGAAPDSEEAAPCRRRAPPEDRRRMEALRRYFRTRTRPPRGAHGPGGD